MSLKPDMELMLQKFQINNLSCCVSLADPRKENCPFIGISAGWEDLTGYTSEDAVGQNGRFLNAGIPIEPQKRAALHTCIANGDDFIGILLNRGKDGRLFRNLVHLLTVFVERKKYVLGFHVDVTCTHFNHSDVGQLRAVVRNVLSSNVSKWIVRQSLLFRDRHHPAAISNSNDSSSEDEAVVKVLGDTRTVVAAH